MELSFKGIWGDESPNKSIWYADGSRGGYAHGEIWRERDANANDIILVEQGCDGWYVSSSWLRYIVPHGLLPNSDKMSREEAKNAALAYYAKGLSEMLAKICEPTPN
jgi:hypothetical protein